MNKLKVCLLAFIAVVVVMLFTVFPVGVVAALLIGYSVGGVTTPFIVLYLLSTRGVEEEYWDIDEIVKEK